MPNKKQQAVANLRAERDDHDRDNRRFFHGQAVQQRQKTGQGLWWRDELAVGLIEDDESPFLAYEPSGEDDDDRPYEESRALIRVKGASSRALDRKGLHIGECPLAPESEAALKREIASATRVKA